MDTANDTWASTIILFLDVDGVLATSRCLLFDFEDDGRDATLYFSSKDPFIPLEVDRLRILEWIVKATGAKIVLSSTWRLEPSMRAFLLQAFEAHGIPAQTVIGDTPSRADGRGSEIKEWLHSQPASSVIRYVIFDDQHDQNILLHHPVECFFKTILPHREDAAQEGLTWPLAHRAREFLTSTAMLIPAAAAGNV